MPLKVSDGIAAWIKDFQKSDAPQFKGKSKDQRRDQAVAAYLSAKRGPLKKEDAFTQKAVDGGKMKPPSRARLDAIQKQKDAEKKAVDKAISRLRRKNESATHASADKKPENYRDEKGRIRVRMVPVKKKVDEEFTFKVDVEGLPALFMKGNSPGSVKAHLRKLVKQPSMVKDVKRVTKHDKKKEFRKRSMEEVAENRRDRLRAKFAAVGKDMKKTNDELKKITTDYKKKFGTKKEYKYDYGSPESVKLMKKITPGQSEDTQNEKMTFNKFRSGLYKTAKAMGDVQAVRKKKVGKRIARRAAGKVTGRMLKKLFNQTEGVRGKTDAPKGPESYEAQYKRRLVKTTDPEHKEKGYKYRIKGKKNSALTKKLYKSKPDQAEFNKQMRRIAGHEFG
jgi:pyridoxine/pyridoxamine 5'-phosphate oxidase